MANRSYPLPGDDGKPGGFPQQPVNGGYSNMYYPHTQDMMMPYGAYGASVPPLGSFNDQCPIPQNTNDQQYGYDSNPYLQYNRHHAMVNYANQAVAYQQAQQSRLTSPQQIADSIYNMAAHAYQNNYQHPGVHQVPYSSHQANSMTNAALSVHTGHSPAGSMHSPAGSTHSMGDRPMLSPHIPPSANAAMYSYNQANQPSPMGHMGQPSHYYNNSNGHSLPRDIDHRPAVERLAAISSPIEKPPKQRRASSSSSRKQSTPKHPNKSNKNNVPQSQGQKDDGTSKNLEPVREIPAISTSQVSEPTNAVTTSSATVTESAVTLTSNSALSAATVTAESKPKDDEVITSPSPGTTGVTIASHQTKSSSSNSDSKTKDKPSDAVPNATQSEKDPKIATDHSDNVTETVGGNSIPDVSHSKSQADSKSPINHTETVTKSPLSRVVDETPSTAAVGKDSAAVEPADNETAPSKSPSDGTPAEEKSSVTETVSKSDPPSSSQTKSKKPKLTYTPQKDNLVVPETKKQDEQELSSPKEKPKKKTDTSKNKHVKEKDGNKESQECSKITVDYGVADQEKALAGDGHVVLSPLGSPSEEPLHSLSSSGASKTSFGDESRLPPRKRKQQLSEHTTSTVSNDFVAASSLSPVIPPKKRGRPSKEMVKLREAAKLQETLLQIPHQQSPAKERKPSGSAKKEKAAKVDKESSEKHSKSFIIEKSPTPIVHNILPKPVDPPLQQQLVPDNKTIAASVGNAVLVSPPKKPKASVAEMQKALMKVVSSSTTDCLVPGKRRRGRPVGSKNKKTLMTEHRARSGSASSKKDISLTILPAKAHESDRTHSSDKNKQVNLQFLHVASTSSAPQMSMKSPSVSPRSLTKSDFILPTQNSSWVCVFCNQITNYKNMGDLYGGYIVQPSTPTPCRLLAHKQQQKSRSSLSDASLPNTEVWFHERCLVWAPGVYMLSGKLYGVYEAVQMAAHTCCTHCKQYGAVVGCYHKGCKNRYHVFCADTTGCLLLEENFSMLCPNHKDKKLVLI